MWPPVCEQLGQSGAEWWGGMVGESQRAVWHWDAAVSLWFRGSCSGDDSGSGFNININTIFNLQALLENNVILASVSCF